MDILEQVRELIEKVGLYEAAIRKHRDEKGDNRCWLDDDELYKVLPEGYTPPKRDQAVELDNCKKYIDCRHNPGTEYVSPDKEIERLRGVLKEIQVVSNPMGYDWGNDKVTKLAEEGLNPKKKDEEPGIKYWLSHEEIMKHTMCHAFQMSFLRAFPSSGQKHIEANLKNLRLLVEVVCRDYNILYTRDRALREIMRWLGGPHITIYKAEEELEYMVLNKIISKFFH